MELNVNEEITWLHGFMTSKYKRWCLVCIAPTLSGVETNKKINIGPQCVQNRRSVGSSRKESKRAVRDCSFNNIQASVTASCSKSV